jgi:hypothetical protein
VPTSRHKSLALSERASTKNFCDVEDYHRGSFIMTEANRGVAQCILTWLGMSAMRRNEHCLELWRDIRIGGRSLRKRKPPVRDRDG